MQEPDYGMTKKNSDSAQSGSFVLSADTAPGSCGALSSPMGCDTPNEYIGAMRWRYANSPAAKQQMLLLAHRQWHPNCDPVPIIGPFATEARQILAALRDHQSPNTARTSDDLRTLQAQSTTTRY